METNGFNQKPPEGIIESTNRKGSTNHRFVLPFLLLSWDAMDATSLPVVSVNTSRL